MMQGSSVFRDQWPREGEWHNRWAPIPWLLMAMGGGIHMLPVKSEIHEKIVKSEGGTVTIHLQERSAR